MRKCPAEAFFADENRVCGQCPAESPYWNENAKKCMSCADLYAGKRPYWNPTFGDCVAECPTGLAPTEGSTCKTCGEADETKPFWDTET